MRVVTGLVSSAGFKARLSVLGSLASASQSCLFQFHLSVGVLKSKDLASVAVHFGYRACFGLCNSLLKLKSLHFLSDASLRVKMVQHLQMLVLGPCNSRLGSAFFSRSSIRRANKRLCECRVKLTGWSTFAQ